MTSTGQLTEAPTHNVADCLNWIRDYRGVSFADWAPAYIRFKPVNG